VSDYNQEQLEAVSLVRHYFKTALPYETRRLKRRTGSYLEFRKQTDQFLRNHFSGICTRKCYEDHYSACCSREGITTFFADVVINILVSDEAGIDRLVQALTFPKPGMKCVYLGQNGCVWRLKPIVCEMFLCEHAKKVVFEANPMALKEWQGLKRREKRYTWPNRPVLFDDLEAYFIRAGHTSSLMYLHNIPGLLRVKQSAAVKRKAARENDRRNHTP